MYNKDNIFAKILKDEIASQKIYEDENVLAFHDKYPQASVHAIVIPKGEYVDYSDFIQKSSAENIADFFSKIAHIVRLLNLESYRLITNKGDQSGQSVFHFHVHIIGGQKITDLL
jgi:hypothetical protein